MSKNKIATAIALCLMISMTVSLIALPAVSGHSPAVDVPTWVYVAVAPNPVGLNQAATFVFWSAQAPPDGASDPDIRWNFDVTVTNPNGNVTSLGKFKSDVEGKASTTFTPDMVGTWNVTVKFPATLYSWSATAEQQIWTGDTFLASSFTASFVVQGETIPEPLPVDYYARGSWFKVTGYYGGYSSPQTSGFNDLIISDDVGSSTPHVMWTRPIQTGGVVGGNNVGVPGDTFYQGLAYNQRFREHFILDGKLYYREPLGETGESGNYIIVDLRNGERLLRTTVSSIGMAYDHDGVRVIFSSSSYGDALGPDTLQPLGWSITGVPSGTQMLGPSNEHLRISIVNVGTSQDPQYNIVEWNASKVIKPGLSGTVDASGSENYDFNVTIKYNGQPFVLPHRSIIGAFVNDVMLTTNFSSGTNTNDYTFWAISLKPENRGEITWNQTYSRLLEGTSHGIDVVDPVNRVIILGYGETMQWVGYNFETGEMWGPTPSQTAYDYYSFFHGGATYSNTPTGQTIYGRLYSACYGGILYCYNTSNGDLLYTYGNGGPGNSTNIEFQQVWGRTPLWMGGIVGGKIYMMTQEHSPNTPLYKEDLVRCVDLLTGKEVWTIAGYVGQFLAVNSMLHANNFTVYLNSYDEQVYALAKGPSATTISANSSVVQGNKIMIKGTVLDICAGTKQQEQAARFPNGVAAVSDEDVSTWMEYVYMHRPRPDVTGVDVTLTAVGPDGSSQQIGTATSDSYGFYNFVYEPQAVGDYTVKADFAGSEAYYPSNAQTTFTVAAAPEPPAIEPEQPPITDTYILISAAGIIIAIAIITAIIAFIIRRS